MQKPAILFFIKTQREIFMFKIKAIIKSCINSVGYDIIRYSRKEQSSDNMIKTEDKPQFFSMKTPKVDKVHYGCGGTLFLHWLNVDLQLQPKQGYFTENVDLVKRHPFMDDVFKFGFSEDFIEHLDQSEQIIFLCEAYRTFQPSGVLRFSFPGLEGVLSRHYKDAKYNTAELAKKEAYDMWGHRHFFSFEELSLLCKHIGYRFVNKVDFGHSQFPELRNLDTRIEQKDLNTYVEVIK